MKVIKDDMLDEIASNPYIKNAFFSGHDLINYNTKRILPLGERISALEGVRGLDGREVELKKGFFPPIEEGETPSPDHELAVMWRLKPRDESDTQEWKVLVFTREIKGDKGDTGAEGAQGDKGADGRNITIKGTVPNVPALEGITKGEVGMAYLIEASKRLYVAKRKLASGKWEWIDCGQFTGMKGSKGDKGDRGQRGAKGDKGDSGGISSFLLSWVVDTATSTAISSVMMEVNTALNDAINDMMMELANLAEDAAQSVVDKAVDELMDTIKGDKGEKGDKGDKGKDGKDGAACTILGHKDSEFELFPITGKAGDAWLVGEANDLYVWTPNKVGGVDLGQWSNVGQVRGQQGEAGKDATWSIQLRTKHNTAESLPILIEPTADGVPNLYIQGTDGVSVERFMDSDTGFRIKMDKPLPSITDTTHGKVLSNDGNKLKWVDHDTHSKDVLLTAPNGTVYKLSVDNQGRLEVKPNV